MPGRDGPGPRPADTRRCAPGEDASAKTAAYHHDLVVVRYCRHLESTPLMPLNVHLKTGSDCFLNVIPRIERICAAATPKTAPHLRIRTGDSISSGPVA